MSTTEVRRSKRANKGIPPSRYTEGSRHEDKERSKVPTKSKKTNASSLRRKKLQAELEAEKQLAEISRQELEIQKKLIQKELEVRQAESRESLLLVEELNLGGKETEVVNMDLKKIRIQQWINNIPSVHTFADESISFSSRSGKAESFEVVKEVPEVEGMYSVKMSKVNPEKNKDMISKLTPSLKLEWGKRVNTTKTNGYTIVDFSSWLCEIADAVSSIATLESETDRRKRFVCTTTSTSDVGRDVMFYRGVLLRIVPIILSGPEEENISEINESLSRMEYLLAKGAGMGLFTES
ncbi:hypothetical protein JTB14_032427 [Gonioctena quinquepunctata]|nr:hypothetical protein JTB14_032427 [Gonioctena quinquepunctata]